MKFFRKTKSFYKRVHSERASVFLEYTLLFAFVAVVAFAPLLPGGPAYEILRKELMLRVFLISMPLF